MNLSLGDLQLHGFFIGDHGLFWFMNTLGMMYGWREDEHWSTARLSLIKPCIRPSFSGLYGFVVLIE